MSKLELLKSTGKNDIEHYEISVSYQKGGTNYATYREEARGVYIHFAVVELEGYSRRMTLFADTSFKILFKTLGRKSKKQLDLAFEYITEHQEELFEAYEALDKQRLLEIVQRDLEVA